jgi:hypothetical protein
MTFNSRAFSTLRGALAGLALASVLFLGMVAGLHVHEDHASGNCDICHHLDHLGLDAPEEPVLVQDDLLDESIAAPAARLPAMAVLGGDPARAPPSLS